jgi:hypothetical protein
MRGCFRSPALKRAAAENREPALRDVRSQFGQLIYSVKRFLLDLTHDFRMSLPVRFGDSPFAAS